MRILASFPGSP